MRIGPVINEDYINELERFFYDTVDEVLAVREAEYFTDEVESEITETLNAYEKLENARHRENWDARPTVKDWSNFYGSVLFNATIAVWVCEVSRTLTNCSVSPDGYALVCERRVFVYDLIRDRI